MREFLIVTLAFLFLPKVIATNTELEPVLGDNQLYFSPAEITQNDTTSSSVIVSIIAIIIAALTALGASLFLMIQKRPEEKKHDIQ